MLFTSGFNVLVEYFSNWRSGTMRQQLLSLYGDNQAFLSRLINSMNSEPTLSNARVQQHPGFVGSDVDGAWNRRNNVGGSHHHDSDAVFRARRHGAWINELGLGDCVDTPPRGQLVSLHVDSFLEQQRVLWLDVTFLLWWRDSNVVCSCFLL